MCDQEQLGVGNGWSRPQLDLVEDLFLAVTKEWVSAFKSGHQYWRLRTEMVAELLGDRRSWMHEPTAGPGTMSGTNKRTGGPLPR